MGSSLKELIVLKSFPKFHFTSEYLSQRVLTGQSTVAYMADEYAVDR